MEISKWKMTVRNEKIKKFRTLVRSYYKKFGRHDLPWRKTTDPYKILVSEVMLQQTQVPRVIEKYKSFLKKFPTAKKLATAPLSEVLKEWSGLGYNRRAKYLHEAAKHVLAVRSSAKIAQGDLNNLPGVGPYTGNAVAVFAFNEPRVLIETNIRAAYIHHFYSSILQNTRISDKEILEIAEKAAPKGSPPSASRRSGPREWHWALMDYGAHIKKLHGNPGRRSAHYAKQLKFEGSLRQVRGEVIRVLAHEQLTDRQLMKGLKEEERGKWKKALVGLVKDGLIKKEKGKWRIA